MITAEIALDLSSGYELEGSKDRQKTKLLIQLPECDVVIWLPNETTFADDVSRELPGPSTIDNLTQTLHAYAKEYGGSEHADECIANVMRGFLPDLTKGKSND